MDKKNRINTNMEKEPIFRLPPYYVQEMFIGVSETQDWGLKLLNIPSLWRITEEEGIKVAILDTEKHGVKSFNATLYFRSTKTLDRLTRFILWKNFDFSQYTIGKHRK